MSVRDLQIFFLPNAGACDVAPNSPVPAGLAKRFVWPKPVDDVTGVAPNPGLLVPNNPLNKTKIIDYANEYAIYTTLITRISKYLTLNLVHYQRSKCL